MSNILADLKQFNKQVIQNPNPVIVEFGAVWCGTCHMLSSSIESLRSSHPTPIDFYHVDFEHAKDVVSTYRISYLPTYLLFKNGRVIDLFKGAISREMLSEKFQKLIQATANTSYDDNI